MPCFETILQNTFVSKLDFEKIEFYLKTQFNENRVTCKMLNGTRVQGNGVAGDIY